MAVFSRMIRFPFISLWWEQDLILNDIFTHIFSISVSFPPSLPLFWFHWRIVGCSSCYHPLWSSLNLLFFASPSKSGLRISSFATLVSIPDPLRRIIISSYDVRAHGSSQRNQGKWWKSSWSCLKFNRSVERTKTSSLRGRRSESSQNSPTPEFIIMSITSHRILSPPRKEATTVAQKTSSNVLHEVCSPRIETEMSHHPNGFRQWIILSQRLQHLTPTSPEITQHFDSSNSTTWKLVSSFWQMTKTFGRDV